MRVSLFPLLCIAAAASAAEFRSGIHTFTVPEGYVVERVAGPPLVDRPITMSFDETGALYVTDSSGSNEKPDKQLANPTHRILRLVDRDGDGIFDERTVFAERLAFPEGTLWLDGSLYVSAPPQIWKFTDTDRDGVAEKREVWFDGGTLTGCANDLHGPYAGPDGFIYWCKGAFDEQRHTLGDGRKFRSRASHVFRARPDGSGLDVVFTAGMDNPVDVAFSPAGEMFVSGTFLLHPSAEGRDGIVHAVHGGVWGKEHNVLDGHPRTGPLMPVMVHRGAAAASGLEILRSDALGGRGDLLCAEFNLRRISRHTLSPDGATFKAESRDLLASDQMDFHPTDVVEDADGSVLIADTGGWYKLCCPTSTLAKPDVLGAIYRVRKADAPKVNDPRGLRLDWAKADVAWLGDPRPAVVERAMAALAKRGEVAPLRELLRTSGDARTRTNAVWTLTRISGEEARAASRVALADADAIVRTAAMHSVALWRDYAATDALLAELRKPDAHSRRGAAMALGRIGDRRAIAPLLEADSGKGDRFLQHAIAYALYEIGAATSLPPDDASELARTVRKMLATSAHAKTLPPIPAPKPAASTEVDPSAMAKQRVRLDELVAQLPGGDAARGAEVFKSAKALCTTCHALGGVGASFGPDLTKVGAIRSERDLLEAIVYPSASLVRSFEPVIVRTRGGEQMGLARKDAADEIILAAAPGAEIHIPRSEVIETQFANISLMPAGFDGLLTPQEIADLIAFLRSAK
jgi:putative membrane-bound dehydrogenase-like protein